MSEGNFNRKFISVFSKLHFSYHITQLKADDPQGVWCVH